MPFALAEDSWNIASSMKDRQYSDGIGFCIEDDDVFLDGPDSQLASNQLGAGCGCQRVPGELLEGFEETPFPTEGSAAAPLIKIVANLKKIDLGMV